MFYHTRTPSSTVGATNGYCAFFKTLILGTSNHIGGTNGGNIVAYLDSSSSYGGGGFIAFFFRILERFPIVVPNEPGESHLNLIVGINVTCSASLVASAHSGTYRE